jgi:sortase A
MSIGFANLKRLEKGLLIVGLVLVGFAAITYVSGRLYSRMAVAKFHAEAESRPSESRPTDAPRRELTSVFPVDYSLWSPKRIKDYEATLAQHFDAPLALLRIDKIRLEVPVFEGTDDRILDRGAGRIEGTARIGESGNVGIAGHRDGFFRGLKDISMGDTMVLETATGTQDYVIDSIQLVTPDDVSVLKSEPTPALTLVTCYPFYFIGSAPQRYIVHASLKGETKTLNEPAKASLQATASRTKENTQ